MKEHYSASRSDSQNSGSKDHSFMGYLLWGVPSDTHHKLMPTALNLLVIVGVIPFVSLAYRGTIVDFKLMVYLLEAAVVFCLGLSVLRSRAHPDTLDEDPEYSKPSRAVREFWGRWTCLWWYWFVLYVVFVVGTFAEDFYYPGSLYQELNSYMHVSTWLQLIPQLLNNVPTTILFALYFSLSFVTIPEGSTERGINERIRRARGRRWWRWWLVRHTGKLDAYESLWWNVMFVAALIEILCMLALKDPRGVLLVFGIIYSLASGVATALFVSQITVLASGVPRLLAGLLIAYGVIQPLSVPMLGGEAFATSEPGLAWTLSAVSAGVALFALLSKIVLYFVVNWLAHTYRLLSLMKEARTRAQNAELDTESAIQDIGVRMLNYKELLSERQLARAELRRQELDKAQKRAEKPPSP